MVKATFEHTVSILVKAYIDDTLEHGNYCACAVGNLIADAVGAQIVPKISPGCGSKYTWLHPNYTGEEWFGKKLGGQKQIKATGYSFKEIWMIEKAFEGARMYPNYVGCTDDQIMFNGLMAVLETLAEIHGINLEQKESAKALFVK